MKKVIAGAILLVLFVVGMAGATPITVDGGWILYYIPGGTAPVPSSYNPFTYTSTGPTHIMVTDIDCYGDVPAIYENGIKLGQGDLVPTSAPDCGGGIIDPDAAYASDEYSHTCVNMPAGAHSFEIVNVQMWLEGNPDGGWVKVEKGLCPGSVAAPEFPTMAVPALFLIGMMGVVLLLGTRRS